MGDRFWLIIIIILKFHNYHRTCATIRQSFTKQILSVTKPPTHQRIIKEQSHVHKWTNKNHEARLRMRNTNRLTLIAPHFGMSSSHINTDLYQCQIRPRILVHIIFEAVVGT